MYKLVVSDMDETFLSNDRGIPQPNVDALRRMHDLGVLFVPSSGRPYPSIMENFADLDQELMEGTYVVSFNGGCINRYGEDKPLVSFPMNRDVAETLYRKALEIGIGVHVYTTDGTIYTQHITDDEWAFIEQVRGVQRIADDVDVLGLVGERDIAKVIYANTDFPYLQRLGESLHDEFAGLGVDISYSSKRYMELMPAGINKGTGLARLAEMLGIDLADTIAVGDSSNDLAMLQTAGMGVGVANVTDDTRGACDLVLDTEGPSGAFSELVDRLLEPAR